MSSDPKVIEILDKLIQSTGSYGIDNWLALLELTDEELYYIASIYGVEPYEEDFEILDSNELREQTSKFLVDIISDMVEKRKKLEQNKYDFEYDGKQYSMNIEILYKHFILEKNKNIPYTMIELPQEYYKDIEDYYLKHINKKIKEEGIHILVVNDSKYSLIFHNFLEMEDFLKVELKKQIDEKYPLELEKGKGLSFLKTFSIVKNSPIKLKVFHEGKFYNFDKNSIDRLKEYPVEQGFSDKDTDYTVGMKGNVEYTEDILSDVMGVFNIDTAVEQLNQFVEHLDRGDLLTRVSNHEVYLPLIDFWLLNLYPVNNDRYKELIDEVLSSDYDFPMYKFCHQDPDVFPIDKIYRAYIAIIRCRENITKVDYRLIFSKYHNNTFYGMMYDKDNQQYADVEKQIKILSDLFQFKNGSEDERRLDLNYQDVVPDYEERPPEYKSEESAPSYRSQ